MDYGAISGTPIPGAKPTNPGDIALQNLGMTPTKKPSKIMIPRELLDLDEAEARGQAIRPGTTVTIRISGRVSSVSRKGFDVETDSAEFEGMTGEAEAGMEAPTGGMPPGGM